MNDSPQYSPKGIAFSPTFECPGLCDHCNIRFDGIDTSLRLPVDVGARVLREGKELGLSAFQIVGGEPTLYEDFFVEVFKEGRRLSMKCHRPPTNCRLGGDEPRLRNFFDRLKSAGFSSGFRISVDYFHRRIPLEWIARFITAAGEYFSLKPYVIGCCDIDERRSEEMLVSLANHIRGMGMAAEYKNKCLETSKGNIRVGFWAPTRPTWKPLPDESFRLKKVVKTFLPKDQFRRDAPIGLQGCLGPEGVGYLWIEPDGGAKLCCGNAVNFIEALKMGNVHTDSLKEILDRAAGSKLIRTLSFGGPVAVATEAGREDLLDGMYTHRCELCHRLLTDNSILEKYQVGKY